MITRKPIGQQPFTTFANTLLNDESLAADALGVLVCLCSKPGNWKVMPGVLAKRFHCGRDKIYRIMNDLIAAGYATRHPERDAFGKITGWNYEVSNEKMPDTENPEVGDDPLPENTTSGESAPQKKDTKTKERDSRSAKGDVPYSEDFEAVWQLFPRTRNTSKKDAWNIYRMLNDENRARVRVAVPAYAAAMKAEGRPEDKIKHMTSWLNGRMYETAVVAGVAGGKPARPWHETATREQWVKLLAIWRGDMNWRLAWGPAPGKPGCGVPDDLLTDDEKSLGSQNRVARK
jgi:hypothetical protein